MFFFNIPNYPMSSIREDSITITTSNKLDVRRNNQVRTPRVLRKRDVKQCDVPELVDKNLFCKGRHTIEVAFSFLENVDSLKDAVPFENTSLLPCALEWVHAIINLNRPLRTPGSKLGLPNMHWD